MAAYFVRETFFRPPEHDREQSALPSALYNDLQLLLMRNDGGSLFLPIRAMQYQAVADREEVIFVDSQGGYAHQDGEGGRLIRVAWRPIAAGQRESLSSPVSCEIVYYFPGGKETQRRLMSELPPLLRGLLKQQRVVGTQPIEPRVIPLRRGY